MMKKTLLLGILILSQTVFGWAQEAVLFKYDDHGKRDPFVSLVNSNGVIINYDSDVELDDIVFQGIMVGSDGQNLAIVNGRILKQNDRLGNYAVETINKDSIILRQGDQKLMIKLKKGE